MYTHPRMHNDARGRINTKAWDTSRESKRILENTSTEKKTLYANRNSVMAKTKCMMRRFRWTTNDFGSPWLVCANTLVLRIRSVESRLYAKYTGLQYCIFTLRAPRTKDGSPTADGENNNIGDSGRYDDITRLQHTFFRLLRGVGRSWQLQPEHVHSPSTLPLLPLLPLPLPRDPPRLGTTTSRTKWRQHKRVTDTSK